MNEELRLGRRIVVCYELALMIVLAIVVGLCLVYHRPWHKVAKRLIVPALLMRPLANGSRWARIAHAAALALAAYGVLRFGLRHPSPTVWSVCGPLSFVLASLSGMIGFSKGVAGYLALRRGEQSSAFAEFPLVRSWDRTVGPAGGHEAIGFARAATVSPSADPCPGCGAVRKVFVLSCPYCGERRDEPG